MENQSELSRKRTYIYCVHIDVLVVRNCAYSNQPSLYLARICKSWSPGIKSQSFGIDSLESISATGLLKRGVGNRLVRRGVCRVSRWSGTGGTLPTCFRLRSFLLRSLVAILHPVASENGRLCYSADAPGFVHNPCSLNSPSVNPL
jgi:hypothetical protein